MVRTSDDSQLRGIPARSVATPATKKTTASSKVTVAFPSVRLSALFPL